MPSTIVERFGSLSATGLAKEPSLGTATLPTSYALMTGNGLELDPGLFSPQVQIGQRDLNIFALYGEYKVAGSVTAALAPTNGALCIPAAIGPDASAGNGVTGSTPSNSTTLSASATAGATTITVTSATGYAVGNYVQVDVNNSTGPTTAEVRKITTINTNTLTLDTALTYGHANGATVAIVQAPFTHTITQANLLGSLTVEKDIGGYDSLQFTGGRVNKLGISVTAGNSEASMSVDFMAQSANILDAPSTVNIINENPFTYAETTLSVFGQTGAQPTTAELSIENGVKDTYTMNQQHTAAFLTPVTRQVTLKTDLVFTSLDDPTWGYYQQMVQGQEGALSLTFQHPGSSGNSVAFSLPRARIKTYTNAVKMQDVVLTTLEFTAFLNLTTLQTISSTIVSSSQYLPF